MSSTKQLLQATPYAIFDIDVNQAAVDPFEGTVYQIREVPTRYAAIDEDVRWCMACRFPSQSRQLMNEAAPS
jgi:hypothetical protein